MHVQVRLFILSTQFLTRLPTPQVADFRPEDLARSALWFPAVGLLIGALLLAQRVERREVIRRLRADCS